MKGPFERLKYDLRRLWECPSCKRRERSDGTVTTRFCTCPEKGVGGPRTAMKLVEEAGHRVTPDIERRPVEAAPAAVPSVPEVPLPPDAASFGESAADP